MSLPPYYYFLQKYAFPPKQRFRSHILPLVLVNRLIGVQGFLTFSLAVSIFNIAAQAQNLTISELMALNDTILMDEDGEFSDWLEVCNEGGSPVNLDGYYLTDDPAFLTKWRFPSAILPADGYLVVFASDKDRAVAGSELHCNYKLTSAGEYLALVEPDGMTIAHEYSPAYPEQYADISYGLVNAELDYMVTPSPGAANIAGGLNHVSPVQFGVERGFYNQAFQVSLSTLTEGAQIRYTLDGSAPTASHGTVYSTPIDVNTTTILRAGAVMTGLDPSVVTTHTYIFVSSVIGQTYPGGGWPAPGPYGPMGQVLDYDMDPEVTGDPRYSAIIDDALLSIPTLSLVTDLNNLFNPSSSSSTGGIYVNAERDGREWERPVSMELLHSDGTPGFQINAGIRIRGGWSRGGENPKHAFRFFFRSEYGDARLRYPLFGEEGVDSFDKIDLRCSTDYSWCLGDADGEGYGSLNTQTRDVFCRDTQRDMGQPYTRSRQYHIYLNGLYWGVYQSQERSEASFAESYMGGAEEDFDAINRRSHSEGAVDGTLDAWMSLWQKTIAGFNSDAAYYAVQGLNPDGSAHATEKKLVDLDNLIDYMLVIYYTGSFDTPISWWFTPDNTGVNNIWCLFNRTIPDGFKYFCHDTEHTLLAHLTNYPNFPWSVDRTGPFTHPRLNEFDRANPQNLHQKLVSHPAYRKHFLDAAYKHFFDGGTLTPEAATARFMERIQEIDPAIIAESARWGDAQQTAVQPPRTKDDDFLPTVDGIVNEFFPNRREVVLGQLKARGWYPETEPPSFRIEESGKGGGPVGNNASLTLENPNDAGKVYYTTDGSDPWLEPAQRTVTTLVPENAAKRVLVPTGPVANWNELGFDDSSWNDGYIDRALDFDAIDDYVDCGTAPGSDSALTVAFWVRVDVGNDSVLIDKYPSGAGGAGWRLRIDSRSRMQFYIGSGSANTNYELQRTYYPDIWNHIAFTFDSGVANVYVDGVGIDTRSGISQTVQNNTTPLRIGLANAVETNLRYDGKFNDVRIYNRALDSGEVANLAARTHVASDLVAHWKFDESMGSTAMDSSGNNNHAALVGGPAWIPTGLGGVGYDEGENFYSTIATDLESEMKDQNPSAYIRIPFSADAGALAGFEFMKLKTKFDAGFVAYLNGQKVAEAGAPAAPEWNSAALSEREDEEALIFNNYDLTVAIGDLVAGTNVLALQGLNSSATDEDFLLSAELIAQDLHPNNEIGPNAVEFTSPVTLTETTRVNARVLDVGEWSPLQTSTFAVGPVTETLRISEIHYHPAFAPDAEFIELKNVGSETLQLNLVRFTNGIDFTFPSFALGPGEYTVLVADPVAFESFYGTGIDVAGVYTGRLDNGGERLRLEDALGSTIHDFNYSDAWYPSTDGGGYSLNHIDPENGELAGWGLSENWYPSPVQHGSPGQGDSGPAPTPTPSSTSTPGPSATPSPTPTPTATLTRTAEPSATMVVPSLTETPTSSLTETRIETQTGTDTPTPTVTPETATPSPTPAEHLSYDRTGEGDIDAKDLVLILGDPPLPDYLFGFAFRWWSQETEGR